MGAGAFEADHRRTVPQDSNPSWKCMTGRRGWGRSEVWSLAHIWLTYSRKNSAKLHFSS